MVAPLPIGFRQARRAAHSIDKASAATLPAKLEAAARQSDTFAGGLASGLRRLQKQLANDETIPEALETARAIVPEIKRLAPDVVARLANVVYWALVVGGEPEDMARYTRIFGSPSDDPQFFRLQAMVMEAMQRLDKAHDFWSKYQNWIARTPDRWPGEMAKRARALVFERMGRLARDWLADEGEDEDLLGFFDLFDATAPSARDGRLPSAEECFNRLELARIDQAGDGLLQESGDVVKAHPR